MVRMTIAHYALSLLTLVGCGQQGFREADYGDFKATAFGAKYEYIHVGASEGMRPLPRMFVRQGRDVFSLASLSAEQLALNPDYIMNDTTDDMGRRLQVFAKGQSRLHCRDGKLIWGLFSASDRFEYGRNREGPFIALPCETEEFHNVFGAPKQNQPFPVTAP